MENLVGKQVFHEEFGFGLITEISTNEEFPLFVEFFDGNLDEVDRNGIYKLEQIVLYKDNQIDSLNSDSVALIIELGALYKEINTCWVYGDLESFVKKHFNDAYVFAQRNEYYDIDECVRYWWLNSKLD